MRRCHSRDRRGPIRAGSVQRRLNSTFLGHHCSVVCRRRGFAFTGFGWYYWCNRIIRFSNCTRPVSMRSTIAAVMLLLLSLQLCFRHITAEESGTVIPAESRPCVDCHAFEFMQRALQDLKKTAFNLDSRTENLVLRAERRALCDCMPVSTLN